MQIHPDYNWKRITPHDAHYFFGYYDRNPWNPEQNLHLTLKVDQCERLPLPGETAEIGVLDGKGGYEPLTTTRAWCPQQGSMELFLPLRKNCFIYNDFEVAEQRMVARIFEIGRGVVGRFDWPIYAISPNGKYGVSLNFSRIPRRGYSYADAALSPDLHPADLDADGLRLVDLESGKSELIVSYRTMLERHPYGYGLETLHIWLNHAIFNCDSTRLLWLFRQSAHPNPIRGWQTFMYTCDLTGADAECILPEVYWTRGLISHQIWGRTPREILVDANWRGAGNEVVVFDESRRPFVAERLSNGHGRMSHLVFSPDGTWILSDSYPNPEEDNTQVLELICAADGRRELLGRFRHPTGPNSIVEVRCDLHPRWSPDGKIVTVDSIHDGQRAVYLLELEPAFQRLS